MRVNDDDDDVDYDKKKTKILRRKCYFSIKISYLFRLLDFQIIIIICLMYSLSFDINDVVNKMTIVLTI